MHQMDKSNEENPERSRLEEISIYSTILDDHIVA
jgi:hypothetical protein